MAEERNRGASSGRRSPRSSPGARGGKPGAAGKRSAGQKPPGSGGKPRATRKPSEGGKPSASGKPSAPGMGGSRDKGPSAPNAARHDRERRESGRSSTPPSRPNAPGRSDGAPELPIDIDPAALDADVRRELRTLPKGLADEVARRLVAAGDALAAEDPELAHAHAEVAVRMASRVGAVREALGLTAYATGRWAQARSELRAARRMTGSDELLPVIADSERGLGHPDRALDIASSPESARLSLPGRVEMRIVAAGARRDLGQLDAAVVTLQCPQLREDGRPWSARLQYAYADALVAAGRSDEATEWFHRASTNDPESETEALERLAELAGVTFLDGDTAGTDSQA